MNSETKTNFEFMVVADYIEWTLNEVYGYYHTLQEAQYAIAQAKNQRVYKNFRIIDCRTGEEVK